MSTKVISGYDYAVTITAINSTTGSTIQITLPAYGEIVLPNGFALSGASKTKYSRLRALNVSSVSEGGSSVVYESIPTPYVSGYLLEASSDTTMRWVSPSTVVTGGSVDLSGYVTTTDLTSTLDSYVKSTALTSALSAYETTAAHASSLASYVLGSTLTTTLSSYVTSGTLSTTLGSYTTISALNTALAGYVSSNALATALSSYETTSALASTLSNYVTSTSLTSTLSSYATTASLSSYVTTSSLSTTLSGYATTSSLSNYLTTSSAASTYISSTSLTTTLTGYVTSSSLSSTLSSYVTSSSLTSTLSSYPTSSSLSTTLSSYVTKEAAQTGAYSVANVSSSATDVLTGTFSPTITSYVNGMKILFRATGANTTTTPTFNADSVGAKTIKKFGNVALAAGDIYGAGHWIELIYDSGYDAWILTNPAVTSSGGSGSTSSTVPVLDAQTGTSYTLALTDAPASAGYYGTVTMNNSAANMLTVPLYSVAAFPVGSQITVIQLGAGATTIAAASGVTLSSASTFVLRAQYSHAVLTNVGTNAWVLAGDLQ